MPDIFTIQVFAYYIIVMGLSAAPDVMENHRKQKHSPMVVLLTTLSAPGIIGLVGWIQIHILRWALNHTLFQPHHLTFTETMLGFTVVYSMLSTASYIFHSKSKK